MDSDTRHITLAAYATPIGWLIALAIKKAFDKKGALVANHMRQGLGLNILLMLAGLIPIPILKEIALIIVIVLAVKGVTRANVGDTYTTPYIGQYFDSFFSFIE